MHFAWHEIMLIILCLFIYCGYCSSGCKLCVERTLLAGSLWCPQHLWQDLACEHTKISLSDFFHSLEEKLLHASKNSAFMKQMYTKGLTYRKYSKAIFIPLRHVQFYFLKLLKIQPWKQNRWTTPGTEVPSATCTGFQQRVLSFSLMHFKYTNVST